MSSNNNFNETFLTKKGEDVTFGEDSTDTMVVNSNAEFNSQTTFNSQINMGGPIIPTINNRFDIGSAEYKVRDLYLSSNSLHIGETILSEETETDGERNIKIKTGDGTENEFKLAKLDSNGRLPNNKMPEGLLDNDGRISKSKIDTTLSLNDLANVDTSGVDEGKALVYSGDTWKPGTVATSGGGGTSVQAHTDTQTGNEDYLSALTVEGVKYKVGTSVSQVSYSDTSKLLLSFPFANATTQAEAETNYGSLSNFTLTNSPELSLVSGGIQSNSSEGDLLSITNLSLSESFTVYLKWLKPGDVSGGSYPTIFQLLNGSTVVSSFMIHDGGSSGGDPNNDILIYHRNGGSSITLRPFGTATFSNDLYFHTFVVYDRDSNKLSVFMNSNGATPVSPDTVSESGLSSWSGTVSNWETVTTLRIGERFEDGKAIDIIYSNLMVFNHALILNDAQDWMDYVERGYVNQGNPASLKYLADVSETTPSNGDSLIYSSLSNQWMPQRAASQFGLPAGDNVKVWVVAGESVSRVGNYPINHVGTGRTFNYDGDGHLYLNHSDGDNYLEITDSNSFMNFSGASYTIAVVVDLSFNDGPWSGTPNNYYSQTIIVQYNSNETHTLVFNNRNSPSHSGKFGIDYWQPLTNPEPFLHNPGSTSYYEGKALIVVTYEYTSDGTNGQRVTIYKNGTQTISMQGDDYTQASTNTFWRFAGNPNQQGGFQTSKFYAAAVWDRVLTTDEISQLSIDKLVTKRQTMPVSDLSDITNVSTTAPLNGDSLVYSSLSSQWMPQRAASQFGLPAGDNAKLWWVAGESVSRVGSYPVTQTGTFDYSYDGDGHLYATNNSGLSSGTRFEINDSDALLAKNDRSFTMAIVIDVANPNVNSIGLYLQLNASNYESHWTYIYNNKMNHNHYPDGNSSNPKWTSTNNISTGKQLIVLASTEHPTNSAIRTISLYVNGSLIETTDSPAETYTGSTPTKVCIGGGNNDIRHLHGSKLYSLATWDRTLTSDEINQLTIDKLVSKRQTLPFYQISDNTPIDGQNLVYSSSTGQYEPKTFTPTEYEVQLCGGNIGTNDIVSGWPRASTVYVDTNATNPGQHSPPKLFDNQIRDYYDGWHSLSGGTTGGPHLMWSDTANGGSGGYVTSDVAENDAYLQIRFTQPRMITKVLMLWRHYLPQQFPKSFSIYGSNTQPSALRSTTDMNLLFSTDGTGYSQPSSTSWSGSAQNNLNSAISFVIPAANQGKYEYLTFHFTEVWSAGSDVVITEMFLFHKVQHFRNYQYKQFTASGYTDRTILSSNQTWYDVNTLDGDNALALTAVRADSTIKVKFIIRGEFQWNTTTTDENFRLLWRLKKTVDGGTPIYLNAPPSGSNIQTTLANAETANHGHAYDAMDTWTICYFDEDGANAVGDVITYTPQIAVWDWASSGTNMEFFINRTIRGTSSNANEKTISTGEAEEILTGPPLTVNNVAISSTPTAGDFIQYNGSAWTNTSVSLNDYVYQGSYEKSGVESFDVNGSGPSYYSSSDELLHYNGGTISTSSSVNILVSDTEDYYVYWDADSLVHQRGSTASTITESITDVAISSMGTIIIYISGNTLKYMNGGTEIFTETTTGALKCALNSAGDTFAVLYSTKVEIYNLAYLASSPHLVGTINFSGVSCENVDIDNSPYFPLQVVVETLNSSNNITLYEIYYNSGNLDNDGGIFYNYQSLYTGGEGRPRFGYFAYFLHANNTLYYKRDYTPATGYYKLTDNVSKISRSGFDYVYKINDVLKHYKLRNGTFHEWHGNVRPIFTNLQDAVGNSGQDMGTFTGSVIQDNKSVKVALQDLETELETKASALNDLTDVSVVNASDLLSYANQPSGSVFSSDHNGGDSYDNLYDGQRKYGGGVDDTYFMIKDTEGTSAAPFELVYTPTSPETVTQVQVWASTGHNGGDDDAYPKTIRVMGELDGSYVEIGSQTLASASFDDKSGDTVTSSNSLHNFTINPNRIAYTKYKLEMYDLYDPGIFNSQYFCKIAEVNFRGIKDGQPLVYDATAGEWQPGSVALDDLTDVSVANAVAQAGHALVYNSSNQWVPAFPQLPYIKVSQTNSASNLTTDGFHFMPFDTVEQSSHNIFSTTNYYHIDVPAGVYLVILNVGYNIVQTDGPDPNYPNPPPPNPFLSAIIERGINGDFVYDGGPMNLPNVSNGRQVTTPSVVTSLSSAGTIRFKMYLYRMNINLYGGARTNQAYIVKIG